MAESAPSGGVAELQKQEEELSARLTTAAQLEAHGEALLQRSVVRSGLGNHVGALEDAERAAALLSKQAECHLRLIEALLACRNVAGANSAYDRAKLIFAGEHPDQDAIDTLKIIDRRLRPVDYVPNEVLERIFELVYLDWEMLPGPFQLCHVNSRWRSVARSTRALWRDTRILRKDVKVPTGPCNLSAKVRRPYCFQPRDLAPVKSYGHPRDRNHIALLLYCARQSCNSLVHFELDTQNSHSDLIRDVLKIAAGSATTLASLSVANTDRWWDVVPSVFDLICKCPRLEELELDIGPPWPAHLSQLDAMAQSRSPMPASLRRVRLDDVDCFGSSPTSAMRQYFLQRCSKLQKLELPYYSALRGGPESPCFSTQLLASCAEHLVELETAMPFNLFDHVQSLGVTVLPQLRRFRHITTLADHGDELLASSDMEMPKLEVIEAPLEMLPLSRLPARVVLRLDPAFDFEEEEDEDGIAYLLGDEDGYYHTDGLEELTIEICGNVDRVSQALEAVFDALTPPIAGKVICPRLAAFSVIRRDEVSEDAVETRPLGPIGLPQARPKFREEWEEKVNVSRLARIEVERRRMSEGLVPDQRQRKITDYFLRTNPTKVTTKTAPPEAIPAATPPRCVALQRVIVDGCYVDNTAWAAMKKSPCHFTVTPDSDEMAALPYEAPQRKKMCFLGERKTFVW